MTPTVTIQRVATVGILVTAAAGLTVALSAPPLPPVTDRIEVRPAFIASTARVLAPSVAAGAVEVRPSVIASTAAVRAPSVQPGAVAVQPTVIASTAQVRAPTVEALAPGAAEVRPAVITSTAAVPAPVVQPGVVSVAPAIIASTVSVPGPAVTAGASAIAPALIGSTASVFAPSVQPGPVVVLPAVIGSTSAVFSPTIQAGASQIAPAIIASTAAVPSPAVQPGPVNVAPALIASTALVRSPTVAVAAAGYDLDAQAAFNAMTVQPAAARKQIISDFIAGAKADGWWSKIIGWQMFAAHDNQAGRVDLKVPSRVASTLSAPLFTVDRGYTGDGAGAGIDTGIMDDPAYQNDVSFGGYVNSGSTNQLVWWGSNANRISANGGARVRANVDISLSGSGSIIGLWAADRSAANSATAYRNGAAVMTRSDASIAPGTPSLLTHRTSTGSFGDARLACVFAGRSMTAADHANLYARLNTFLTAIGAA